MSRAFWRVRLALAEGRRRAWARAGAFCTARSFAAAVAVLKAEDRMRRLGVRGDA